MARRAVAAIILFLYAAVMSGLVFGQQNPGEINGTVVYANNAKTPLQGIKVFLSNSNGMVVDSAVSDKNGAFGFTVSPGSYYLSARNDSAWPWGASNALDALIVTRHFVGLDTLQNIVLKASDVNIDSSTNATDAYYITRRFTGYLDHHFGADWVNLKDTVYVGPGQIVEAVIPFLVMGDVNHDWIDTTQLLPFCDSLRGIAGGDTTICLGDNITLHAFGSGNYVWSTGMNDSAISLSPAMSMIIYLTVTDGFYSCRDSVLVQVDPNVPSSSLYDSLWKCAGMPLLLDAGTQGDQYQWSTGSDSSTTWVQKAGVYSVLIRKGTCYMEDSTKVKEHPAPSFSLSAGEDTLCKGAGTVLQAHGVYYYSWDHGLGSGNAHWVEPTSDVTYTVTATDQHGCTASRSVSLAVRDNPNVNASATPDTICRGATTVLSVTGGHTYNWNKGLGKAKDQYVNPDSTTTYMVLGFDQWGCSDTAWVTVVVHESPVCSLTASPQHICLGDSALLEAAGGSNYQWSGGLGGGSAHWVHPQSATAYSVTAIDGQGCSCVAGVDVVVHNPPVLNVTASKMTVCDGVSTTLSASGADSYTWSHGLGSGASHTVMPGTSTTYTVTGTDVHGCTATGSVSITVLSNPQVTIHVADSELCRGDSRVMTANGASFYFWDHGLGAGSQKSVSPQDTITYHVWGLASNGCSSTAKKTINVNDNPIVHAATTKDTVVAGTTAEISATGASSYHWGQGIGAGAQHTVMPLMSTTYAVTGTNTAGCTDTDAAHLTVVPASTMSAHASPDSICPGDSSTLQASGMDTYVWDHGLGSGATQSVSPGVTTMYTVIGTDIYGFMDTLQLTVTVLPLPVVNASATYEEICEGESTQLSASGAHSYAWGHGLGSGQTHVVSPGVTTTYTVTGTTTHGCGSSDAITITVHTNPPVTLSAVDDEICTGEGTTLTAAGADSYAWSHGLGTGGSNWVTPNTTTTYTVTGTDTHGCSATDELTVTVHSNPPVVATATATEICDGESTDLGASGADTYTWDNGLGAGATHTVSPSTTTTYTVTGTDTHGCSATDQVLITVDTLPLINATAVSDSICGGTSTQISVVGADSYTWDQGLGSGATHLVNPLSVTTYKVTGTNSYGCSGTDSVTIKVYPLVIAAQTSNNTLCPGESTFISASGASTYTWDQGLGSGAGHTVSPASTTVYTVTGTDGLGCFATDAVTVAVHSNPPVSATATATEICDGQSTDIEATGADSYAWDNGLGTGATHTVIPSSTTTYTVTGTDIHGCTGTDQILITVDTMPLINASATSDSICGGTSTQISAVGADSYIWDQGLGVGATHLVTPLSVTTYQVTGTNSFGCSGTDSVTIKVYPLVIAAQASNDTLCPGESTAISASGAINYTWDQGLGGGAGHIVSPTSTTVYTVTGTDGLGCFATDAVTVAVHSNPTVSATATATEICDGESTDLVASGADTYAWDNSLGTGATHTVSLSSTTTYTVTGTDTHGCSATDEVTVTVYTEPTVLATATATEICDGESTDLGASGADTYAWDNSLGIGATHTVSPSTTTTYTVTGTDSHGCSATDEVTVTVHGNPTVLATATATEICEGESTDLEASGADTYVWDNGLGTGANHTVSPGGTVTYSVTGTSQHNCQTTDTIRIVVKPLPLAFAGSDTLVYGIDTLQLNANDPGGDDGLWRGIGNTSGASFLDDQIFNTIFDGYPGICYQLEWSVTAAGCTARDTLGIRFEMDCGTLLDSRDGKTYSTVMIGEQCWMQENLDIGTRIDHSVAQTDNGVIEKYCMNDADTNCDIYGGLYVWEEVMDYFSVDSMVGICPGGWHVPSDDEWKTLEGVVDSEYNEGDPEWDNSIPGRRGYDAGGNLKEAGLDHWDAPNTGASNCSGFSALAGGYWEGTVNPRFLEFGTRTYLWTSSIAHPNTTTWYRVLLYDDTKVISSYYGPIADAFSIRCIADDTICLPQPDPANAGPDTIVQNADTIILYANDPVNGNGSWTIITGSGGSLSGAALANATLYGTPGEYYELKWTITTPCGQESDTVGIMFCNLIVSASAVDTALCSGESTDLQATGADTYTWDNGLGIGATHTVSPSSTTTYTVTGTNTQGCTDSDLVTITVNPLPLVDAGSDTTICGGGSASIGNAATGGTAPFTYAWSNGSSNAIQSVSPSITTTYTVTVTDANACTATDEVTVTVALPLANAGSDKGICIGGSTSIGNTATGGTAPYTYAWSNGSGNATQSVSPAITTTYTVTVTDDNGCTDTDEITVTVYALPTADAGSDAVICQGESASIGNTATGGTVPYSYAWSNGSSNATQSVSPASTTTYTVTVTDDNGCTDTDEVTVTVNPVPVADAGSGSIICEGESASIGNAASGGTPPYSYAWSNGPTSTTQTVSPASTTTYTVTVTDANGCTDTDEVLVTVSIPLLDVGVDTSICSGDSIFIGNGATGGIPPYSYNWDGVDTSAILLVSPASTSTYSVTATDANGCTDTDQITVTVNALPEINAGTDTIICYGGTALIGIGAVGGTSPYSYYWSNDSTHAVQSVSPDSTTTYTATVTDINGCKDTDTVLVTVGSLPVPDAGQDTTICPCASFLLESVASSGTPPYTYEWSTGSDAPTAVVSPTTDSTYTVTVSDSYGCTATDDVTVSLTAPPTCGIITDSRDGQTYNTVVIGDQCWMAENLNYAATGSSCYGNNSANCDIYGRLYLASTAMAGDAFSSRVPSEVQGICPDGWHLPSNAEYDILANALGGEAVAGGKLKETSTVHWLSPNTGASNSSCFTALGGGYFGYLGSIKANAAFWTSSPNASQRHIYRVLGYFSDGIYENGSAPHWNDQMSVRCVANLNPTADAGANVTICLGDSTSIGNPTNAGFPPYSYLWSNGSTDSIQTVSPTSTTSYTVTVSNSLGNTDSDEVTVTLSVPLADAGIDTTICPCASFLLESVASSGTSPYTYEWSTGSDAPTALVSPTTDSTYTVTVSDSYGCTATDDVTVSLTAPPTCGIITDSRDGQTYNTVVIGDQCWMAENLNYDTSGSSCNNCSIYGRLYNWDLAMAGASSSNAYPSGVQGVCPDGWHLPSNAEYDTLAEYLGGSAVAGGEMKETSAAYWNSPNTGATNSSCFTALPGGYNGGFVGTAGYFWTSWDRHWRYILNSTSNLYLTSHSSSTLRFSVRCVANLTPTADAGDDVTICLGDSTSIGNPTNGGFPPYSYSWSNGSTDSIHTVSPTSTTTYTVTVTNSLGNTDSDDVTVTLSIPLADAGQDTTICPCASFLLESVASSGTPPYTYEWSTGSDAPTAVVSPTTDSTYTVTVSDSYGCTATDDVTVSLTAPPTCGVITDSRDGQTYNTIVIGDQCWMAENLNYEATGSSCYGNNSANCDIYGRLYSWDIAMASEASSNSVPSGVQGVCPEGWHLPSNAEYDILATFLGGAAVAGGKMKETSTAHWNSPNTGATNSSCFTALGGGCSGGYVGTYGYFWTSKAHIWRYLASNSDDLFNYDGLEDFGFSLRCVADTIPSADAGFDREICLGVVTSIGDPADGGTPPYSYVWSNGSTNATQLVSPAATTTYTVTVTDDNGYSDTDEVTITIASPIVDAGADASLCKGESISIGNAASGGMSPYSYTWSNGITTAAQTVSPDTTTTFYVTVADVNTCSNTDSVTITVNLLPMAYAGSDDTVCVGDSTLIGNAASSGTSPYNYSWSNSSTDATQFVSPPTTTTYRVTVTDANGCTGTDNVVITVGYIPIANAGADITICPCASTRIGNTASSGTPPYTYLWSDSSTSSMIVVKPETATTYTVTATDAYGCTDTDDVTVSLSTPPTCDDIIDSRDGQTYKTVIIGDQCWMAENLNYAASGSMCYDNDSANCEVYGRLYDWSTLMDGAASSNSVPSGVQGVCPDGWHLPSNAEYDSLADYLGGTDVAGGELKERGTVHWNSPNAGATNSTCFTALPGGFYGNFYGTGYYFEGTYSYFWTSRNGHWRYIINSSDDFSLNSINYDFSFSVRCVTNMTPIADAGDDVSICSGDSASIGKPVTSGFPPYSYEWDDGNTDSIRTISPASTTTYTVTVTNSLGNTDSDEVTVTLSVPLADAGQDTAVCMGSSITIAATVHGGTPQYDYEWSDGGTADTTVVGPVVNTTYTVTVTDAVGCTDTDEVTVNVHDLPDAHAGSDTAVCSGSTVTIGNPATGGTAPYTYLWSDGATDASPTVSLSATTTYTVTVIDANSCTGTDSVEVTALALPVADAGPDKTICPCGSTELEAGASGGAPPYLYSWSNGGTDSTTIVNPAVDSTFTVTVTDTNGCTDTDDVTVSLETPPSCGVLTDSRDGKTYNTVMIGDQCWMAENLAYLPSVIGPDTGSGSDPYNYVYGYDGTNVSAAKATNNYETYGVLYNWPAVMAGQSSSDSVPSGVQGICPTGWHLPSDAEWAVLTDSLGGLSVAGGKMKERSEVHWNSPNTGASNTSCFTALPGGSRLNSGNFNSKGQSAYFWSSTENSSAEAWYRYLENIKEESERLYYFKVSGFSVRCVKD